MKEHRRRGKVPHLLGRGGRAALRALAAGRALVAFDFDGTLVPIADRPGQVRMSARMRRLLGRVARLYPCAVISGRAYRDLRRRFRRVPLVALSGSHGAEGLLPAAMPVSRPAPQGWVRRLRARLRARLRRVPGVSLEPKPHGVAVHYRGAEDRAATRTAILEAVAALDGVRCLTGKCVVEVLPADAPTKGDALGELRRRLKPRATLYVGDDTTDEDAFASRGPGGLLPVRVAPESETSARFRLDGQAEVEQLLRELVRLARPK